MLDSETYTNEAGSDFYPATIARIWNKYEELLKAQKSLDFDDLVSKVVFLLKKRHSDKRVLSKSLGIYFDRRVSGYQQKSI